MPLKRSKKTSKKAINEDTYSKVRRTRIENEAKEAKAKAKAEEEAKKEEARKHKIVYKYVSKLADKFKETDSTHFWVWADTPGFKKIMITHDQLRKALATNPEKYKNRKIAHFSIQFRHDKRDKEALFGDPDKWMSVFMTVHQLDKTANLDKKTPWGCHYVWLTDDFKITKFSFKLLETIMKIVSNRHMTCESIGGIAIRHVLDRIKKERIKFDYELQPLSNV